MIVRDSIPDDPLSMAPYVRMEDGIECIRSEDKGPLDALEQGLRTSTVCKTIDVWGRPIAMFGVIPGPPHPTERIGLIWMLGTPDIITFGKTITRAAFPWIDFLSQGFTVVGNYVDALNVVHVNWLSRMGCSFVGKIDNFGPYRSTFLQFQKQVHNV